MQRSSARARPRSIVVKVTRSAWPPSAGRTANEFVPSSKSCAIAAAGRVGCSSAQSAAPSASNPVAAMGTVTSMARAASASRT